MVKLSRTSLAFGFAGLSTPLAGAAGLEAAFGAAGARDWAAPTDLALARVFADVLAAADGVAGFVDTVALQQLI
jgi:hypothetical protein